MNKWIKYNKSYIYAVLVFFTDCRRKQERTTRRTWHSRSPQLFHATDPIIRIFSSLLFPFKLLRNSFKVIRQFRCLIYSAFSHRCFLTPFQSNFQFIFGWKLPTISSQLVLIFSTFPLYMRVTDSLSRQIVFFGIKMWRYKWWMNKNCTVMHGRVYCAFCDLFLHFVSVIKVHYISTLYRTILRKFVF